MAFGLSLSELEGHSKDLESIQIIFQNLWKAYSDPWTPFAINRLFRKLLGKSVSFQVNKDNRSSTSVIVLARADVNRSVLCW